MSAISSMVGVNDKGFRNRVKWAMQKAAIAIMGETAGPRTVYATAVLDGSASIQEMAISVSTDSAVETALDTSPQTPSDIEIDNAITARWDAMSGVTGP